MRLAVGLEFRHQTGDVAVDEELALIGAEDRGHMDPRVAAGDHHRPRPLPVLGQPPVPDPVLGIARRLPAMEALDQVRGERTGEFHGVPSRRALDRF
jgi:hypothetical protein